jgi:hypothetical protein
MLCIAGDLGEIRLDFQKPGELRIISRPIQDAAIPVLKEGIP